MGETHAPGVVNASFRDENGLGESPISISTTPHLSGNKQVASPLPESRSKLKNAVKFFSTKKELIPLKIVLFCWYGAFSSLLPYMTIYLKQLGINAKEIAFIYTFFPIAKLLGPAIGGLISDKLGRYKPVLYISLICDIVFATSFLFIPSIPEKICSTNAQLSCVRDKAAEISINNCCDNMCRSFSTHEEIEIISCKILCGEEYINKTENYSMCFATDGGHECFQNNQTIYLNITHKSILLDTCYYSAQPTNNSAKSQCFAVPGKQNCSAQCSISIPVVEEKVNCEAEWSERFPTLAITFAIFIAFQVFVAICFALIEATALAMVKQHEDDYGRQRFWAILATAIFSPITGLLVDVATKTNGYDDYSPAFYLFDVLIVTNIIMVYVLDLSVSPPAKRIIKNITQLIKMPEVVIFLIVVFFLGTFWGFLESFLFWQLLDLGSPKYLLGLTLTVGALVGLPFLYTSDWFVEKFGRVNLLIIAFVFYSVRCIGYSYIKSPWWFVLFEAMEASTYHLMWVAAATYAASLAPKGLLATIQGCVAGLHYGLGRGSGSLIGGNLMSVFGNRVAFRSMGVAAGIIGVLYAFIYSVFLSHKKSKKNDMPVPKDGSTDLKMVSKCEDIEKADEPNKGTKSTTSNHQ